jgi:hypothetical protein
MTDSTHDFFDTLASVLLRCWIFGFLLLLLWFGFYTLARELIYRLHGSLFWLGQHELDLIQYCSMAFVKLSLILFFLFPWAAIRLALKKRAG